MTFIHTSAPGLDKLWVVAVVNNYARYSSRYNLFSQFKQMVEQAGVNLMIVEVALGDRPFEMTQPNNPNHIQLRTWDELWHKENMINIGISRLPADWEYVAWIDGDIGFVRNDWAQEIVHQLQHYQVIQLFQTAIDLGPTGEAIRTYDGFVYSYLNGNPPPFTKGNHGQYIFHPGYAWAARREAIDALGGLFDYGVLGSSDHHMAHGFFGKIVENAPKKISEGYKKSLLIWQDRALKHIRGDVGFMTGSIYHFWHGSKVERFYNTRWDILLKHKFDPYYDLKQDWQGLYSFTDAGLRMRDDIRNYFRVRNEDGINK